MGRFNTPNAASFKSGTLVKHFKRELEGASGHAYIYKIIGVAEHTETGEDLMIYKKVYSNKIYARPLSMFMSKVDKVKYPTVKQEYRFEELTEEDYLDYYGG